MSALPPDIRALIDEVLKGADLDAESARVVRVDLERHFEEGLLIGRPPSELIARFGPAEAAARSLARAPRPRDRARSSGAEDGPLSSLLHDLRFGTRALLKRPTLTAAAAAVLALGIGANTLVFTVLNTLLLRPLPVEDPSTLVDVWPEVPGGNSFEGFAVQDFEAYRDADTPLRDLAAFTGVRLQLGEGESAVVGMLVSPEYFPMMGLEPALGRLSFGEERRFGQALSVVLSHSFWEAFFGGDPDIVGQDIRLDDHVASVVGVGPPGFSGHFIGFPVDVWLPITAADPLIDGFDQTDRSRMPFEMIGRLRTGASAEAAEAALNAVAESIERAHPELKRGHRVGVTPTTGLDHSLRTGVVTFVGVLAAVSALVLLIACLNVGGLLLVRAMSREREIAVRLALGAGTWRLVRQLLAEALLLVLAGGILGTIVAVQANDVMEALVDSLAAGLRLELTVDLRVLGLTAGVSLVAAMLAAAAPALHLLRKDPAGALRTRATDAAAGARLRSVLVVGQVAASVALLVATGLLVRGLLRSARENPGFDPDRLVSFTLSLDPERVAPEQGRALQREVMDALAALPGVEAVTLSDAPVLGVARTPAPVDVPGVPPPPDRDRWIVDARTVGSRYFAAAGIPLTAGRGLTEADDRESPPVAVVSRAFARRFWPRQDPLGRSFLLRSQEVRVVGVAADARYLAQDPTPDPVVYVSLAGRYLPSAVIGLRARTPLALTGMVRSTVQERVPDHRPPRLRTPRETLELALFPQRAGSLVVGAMGLCALVLAAVGLYGLVQYTVARDTHALGVRLALGGTRVHVLSVVLRKGLLLVAAGMGLGTGLALIAAPGLAPFLAGLSPADPLTFGTVILAFAAVAVLASWMPARRALRIPPTEALRAD